MRLSDLTRQTRWGHEPEALGSPPAPATGVPTAIAGVELPIRVELLTWTACPRCDIQVHGLAARAARAGLDCPECGSALLHPDPSGVRRIETLEATMNRQGGTTAPGP